MLSVQALMLLTDGRERAEVESILNFVVSAISRAKVLPEATVGLDAATWILSRWHRGELRGKRIGNAYTEELERRLREYNDDSSE